MPVRSAAVRSGLRLLLHLLLLVWNARAAESPALPRVNIARYQTAQASTATAADPAAFATDGIVGNANRWRSSGIAPHWLAISFPFPIEVGSAHLYLGRDDLEPVANFSLQSWDGVTWTDIPGTVIAGNTRTVLRLTFASPVRTSRIRFFTRETAATVRELALFGDAGAEGYPIGTDVVLNLARGRPAVASSAESGSPAKRAFDGYADDAARWKSANVNGPHTLEVDLQVASRVGSVHLYTGSSTGPPISEFTLQYWTGSSWLDIAGTHISSNASPVLRIPFAKPVSTSRIRLWIPGNGSQRVRELAVFAAAATGDNVGYPLGTGSAETPPPSTRFDTYGDAYHRLVNLAASRPLTTTISEASLSAAVARDPSVGFQLLYNLDTDTFRIRSRDTDACIAASRAEGTNGTPVVETAFYHALPHECWRLQSVGTGLYRIVNAGNGMVLEAASASVGSPVTLASPVATSRQYWRIEYDTAYPRKGTAGYDGDWQKFRASWSYNWSRDTSATLPGRVTFAPMQHNRWWPDWNTLPSYQIPWHTTAKPLAVLGFNEPDHTDQANMSVADAIALWPKLEQSEVPLVSPSAANAFGGWMADFYKQADALGFRIDYTAVHRYANPDASGLISHLQSAYNTWGRPIWLTEFSCVDWAGVAKWTEEDNYRFLAEFLWRAEDLPWLKRYSIFSFSGTPSANPWDRNGHRSDVFNADGTTFTPFGELYAAWDADRTLREHTPYLLHNVGGHHRLRNPLTTDKPGVADIRRSDNTVQWVLAPSATAGRWQLTSVRDGRRLRYDGTVVDLASPGTTGTAVEFQISLDSTGATTLRHPTTSRILRLNRVNNAAGAPTQLDLGMIAAAGVTDASRWRFIKPYQPVLLSQPQPPTQVTATPGTNGATLHWPASTSTNILHYIVYRGLGTDGSLLRLDARVNDREYLDTSAAPGTTYRYAVSAVDWFEAESSVSPKVDVTLPLKPGTYAAWVAGVFANTPAAARGFAEDPDQDGLPNGLEYLLGTDPLATSSNPLRASLDPGGFVVLEYDRSREPVDVEALVVTRLEGDGTTWEPAPTELISSVPVGSRERIRSRVVGNPGPIRYFRLGARLKP